MKLTQKNLTEKELATVRPGSIERIADDFIQRYRQSRVADRDQLMRGFIRKAHNGKDDSNLELFQMGVLKKKLAAVVATSTSTAIARVSARATVPTGSSGSYAGSGMPASLPVTRHSDIRNIQAVPLPPADKVVAAAVKKPSAMSAEAESNSSGAAGTRQLSLRGGSSGQPTAPPTASGPHVLEAATLTARKTVTAASKPSTGRLGTCLSDPDTTMTVSASASAAGGRNLKSALASTLAPLVEKATGSYLLRSDTSNQQRPPATRSPPTSPLPMVLGLEDDSSMSAAVELRSPSSTHTSLSRQPLAVTAVSAPTGGLPSRTASGRLKRVIESPASNAGNSPAKAAKSRHQVATTTPTRQTPTPAEASLANRDRRDSSSRTTDSSPVPMLPSHPPPAVNKYGSTSRATLAAAAIVTATPPSNESDGECQFI